MTFPDPVLTLGDVYTLEVQVDYVLHVFSVQTIVLVCFSKGLLSTNPVKCHFYGL